MTMPFSEDIRNRVLKELSEGKSLRQACQGEGMPHPSTVCMWVRDEPDFARRYRDARFIGYTLMADDVLDIADDGSNDFVRTDKGKKPDKDHIMRSRLRVDTRKWVLAKALPKFYGDKIAVEASGPDGAPLEVVVKRTIVRPNDDES